MASDAEERALRAFQIPAVTLSPRANLQQGPTPQVARPTTVRNASGNIVLLSGVALAPAALVLGADQRDYLIIQNTSSLYNLFVGFSDFSNVSAVPNRSFIIFPGAAYEPLVAPNNDVWLAGNINGVSFTVGYISSCH